MQQASLCLPPELVRLVLASCIKENLRSCSLVSHTWREIARYFLFSDIECKFSDGTSTTGKLAQLQEFLQASPAICACVRVLTLRALPKITSPRRYDAIPDETDARLCLSILSSLPRLDTVYLTNIHLTGPSPANSRRCMSMTLVELTYTQSNIYVSLENVIQLANMFEQIDMLRIGYCCLETPSSGNTANNMETKISAVFSEIMDAEGVTGLVGSLYENTLRSLHIDTTLFDGTDWVYLRTLMESGVGTKLTHLGFSVGWELDGGMIMQYLLCHSILNTYCHVPDIGDHGSLSVLCPRLESFTLHSQIWITQDDSTKNWKFWSGISQLIPFLPLTVRSIILVLEFVPYHAPRTCESLRGVEKEMVRMEATIASRFGKSLPTVTFKPKYDHPFSLEEEECLKSLFPMLAQERLICFGESVV